MNAPQRPAPSMNFASRMAATSGHPSGFDYLRLFLAIEVLVWHTVLISYGLGVQNDILNSSIFRAIPSLILPMFFALSGFLVAGSLERAPSIFAFACLRILRIYPALFCVVVLAALVLGPLVTAYPLNSYFSDPLLASYFMTLLGDVRLLLPGVFLNNPFGQVVNGQLWTIPMEMTCYGLLAVSALIGIYRRPAVFLSLVLLMQGAFAARAFFGSPIIWGGVPPSLLFLCFLAGSVLYLYRAVIPWRTDMALLCGLLGFGLIYIRGGSYFIAAPMAYVTIYLGLLNPRKMALVRSGDYSYGIYLFAFPLQQIVAMLGSWAAHWYINLTLSLPLTFVMAFASWHLVEKKALSLRRHIPQLHAWVRRFFFRARV